MDETAQLLINELRSLDRRVAVLESIILKSGGELPPASPPKDLGRRPYRLRSFEVHNVFFHYKDPGYAHMKQVLDELIGSVNLNKRRNRPIQVYAEFVTGRPDLSVDATELPPGFKILLLITTRNPSIDDNVFRSANFDAQIVIELDGTFAHISKGHSQAEINKFEKLL